MKYVLCNVCKASVRLHLYFYLNVRELHLEYIIKNHFNNFHAIYLRKPSH